MAKHRSNSASGPSGNDAAAAVTLDEESDAAASPPPPRKPSKERASGGRRFAFWFGIGLMLAGLAVLGWVAWQFWGTNWVSQREQKSQIQSLEKAWDSGQRLEPKDAKLGSASAIVKIPKLGKDYAIPVLEGTSDKVLAKGYAHFPKTAGPGQVGNYAIAGHRVTHGEPLARMPELRPGDKVIVETGTTIYTYRLDTNPNDLIVDMTKTWVIEPQPKNPDPQGVGPRAGAKQKLLTLVTCSELFHTDNRMVAFGHLVSEKPRT